MDSTSEALAKITSNPVSKAIYDALEEELNRLGFYDIEPKKTSLHVTHGRAFLGVHPRKNGLLLKYSYGQSVTKSSGEEGGASFCE